MTNTHRTSICLRKMLFISMFQINNGLWRNCALDEENSVEVGRLMTDNIEEKSKAFVLNTGKDKNDPCYFTTMDIDFDELHEADKEFNDLQNP